MTGEPGTPLHPWGSPATVERALLPDHCGVLIIGAGITGTTLAVLLAGRGHDVTVIDAGGVASVTTGNSTAKVTVLHGGLAGRLRSRWSADHVQAYLDANGTGLNLVRELIDRHRIECDHNSCDAYTYARDAAELQSLLATKAAMRDAGVEVSLSPTVEIDVAAAIAVKNQLRVNPRRYVEGLADVALRMGARFCTGVRATGATHSSDGVLVATDHGDVLAKDVVVATLLPAIDRGAYFGRASPSRSYIVALETDRPVLEGMYVTADDPIRSVRPITFPNRESGLLLGGAGHRTGEGPPERVHYDALRRWGEEHWPQAREVAHWSAQDYRSIDELPFIGRQPGMANLYVAAAFDKWGMTNGSAAAMMLVDALEDRPNPWAFAFDATRFGGWRAVGATLRESAVTIGGRWIGSHVRRLRGDTSPTCTHMGCKLRKNVVEDSWDCSCHGSRFDLEGRWLEGVATRDLPSAPPDV